MSSIAAVPVLNRKGQLSMQPTKVERYRRGKIPSGASMGQEEGEESEEEGVLGQASEEIHSMDNEEDEWIKPSASAVEVSMEDLQRDRRFKRLMTVQPTTERRFQLPDQTTQDGLRVGKEAQGVDEKTEEVASTLERAFPERRKIVSTIPSVRTLVEKVDEKRIKLCEVDRTVAGQEDDMDEEGEEEEDEEDEEDEKDEEDEGDEEDEDEDVDDDVLDAPSFPSLKPIFVPKHERTATVVPQVYTTEMEVEAQLKRQQESKKLLEEERQRELLEEQQRKMGEENETDDPDDPEMFALWTEREMARLQRDEDEEHAKEREQAYLEQRRQRTLEEKRMEAKEVRERQREAQQHRPKMKFLQKYYHKGTFYLDDATQLLQRNYAEATLEDHFHKESLPEVLQRRNYGKASQSKWTHLVKEDTSQKDVGWYQDKTMVKRVEKRRGGMGDIDRPSKYRR